MKVVEPSAKNRCAKFSRLRIATRCHLIELNFPHFLPINGNSFTFSEKNGTMSCFHLRGVDQGSIRTNRHKTTVKLLWLTNISHNKARDRLQIVGYMDLLSDP